MNNLFQRAREELAGYCSSLAQHIRDRPVIALVAAIAVICISVIGFLTVTNNNTGFEKKALWDWLDLLIVPLVLAVGAWWLNRSEKKSSERIASEREALQRKLAHEQRQEAMAEDYFDRMGELLIEKGLRTAERDSEVRTIARARTLSLLRALDGDRKRHIVSFLYEALLIGRHNPIVELEGADLSHCVLSDMVLSEVSFQRANLRYSSFVGVDFSGTNFHSAQLDFCRLVQVDLSNADLSWCSMTEASLDTVDLSWAKIAFATFENASVRNTDLHHAEDSDQAVLPHMRP